MECAVLCSTLFSCVPCSYHIHTRLYCTSDGQCCNVVFLYACVPRSPPAPMKRAPLETTIFHADISDSSLREVRPQYSTGKVNWAAGEKLCFPPLVNLWCSAEDDYSQRRSSCLLTCLSDSRLAVAFQPAENTSSGIGSSHLLPTFLPNSPLRF